MQSHRLFHLPKWSTYLYSHPHSQTVASCRSLRSVVTANRTMLTLGLVSLCSVDDPETRRVAAKASARRKHVPYTAGPIILHRQTLESHLRSWGESVAIEQSLRTTNPSATIA